jgi:membrane fusion protein, multidrug efflux system
MRKSDGLARPRQSALWRAGAAIAFTGIAALTWRLLHSEVGQVRSSPDPKASVPSVVVTVVKARDVAVELKGMGVVQAYNTVIVKPRINGQITDIVFREGQAVRKGEVLARIDDRYLVSQLHQAQANSAKDEAQLANARRDLGRLTDELVRAFVSKQLVDAQKAQVAVLEATVRADAAAIENAQVQLGYTSIAAPIDGITGMRMIDVGNVVSPTDPGIVTITQIRPIAVVFTLPADVSAEIPSRPQDIPVEVFDRHDRLSLAKGGLALVDNQIDRTTNTVRLKALFDNADGALRAGAFVNAHVLKTQLRSVPTISKHAVQYDDTGPFVWVVRPDMTVLPARISLGPPTGDSVVVDRGLSPGDKVVLDGQYNLHAGTHVQMLPESTSSPATSTNALNIP